MLGSAAGLAALRFTDAHEPVALAIDYLAVPFSKLWFNALFMMVIPLVISTLAVGVVRVRQGSPSGAARPPIDWRHTLLALLALTGGMLGLALASVVPLESDRRTVIASVLNAYSTATATPSIPMTFDLDTLLRV